jgi:hypothetical protein
MSTVVKRTFASSPVRDAHATWMAIVDLLTRSATQADRDELVAVAGSAASVISDQAPRSAPIVVTCDGPRTRVYCIYDEDALDGSDVNEASLQSDPLNGEWAISLPCPADDLSWINAALARHSARITARDQSQGTTVEASAEGRSSTGLVFDPAGFLGS